MSGIQKVLSDAATTIQNGATAAKNWAVANQDQIITVLKVLAVVAIILGTGYAIGALGAAPWVVASETMGGGIGFQLNGGCMAGAAWAIMGFLSKTYLDEYTSERARAAHALRT